MRHPSFWEIHPPTPKSDAPVNHGSLSKTGTASTTARGLDDLSKRVQAGENKAAGSGMGTRVFWHTKMATCHQRTCARSYSINHLSVSGNRTGLMTGILSLVFRAGRGDHAPQRLRPSFGKIANWTGTGC